LEISLDSGFGTADGLDFNGLDAGSWDALATIVLAALPAFFATALRAFAAGVLTEALAPARAAFAAAALGAEFVEDPLEDFLRVFLDIRLPFVAFGGSTNRVLRVSSRSAGFAPAAGQV
jgi:hypothetical protein